MRVRDRLRNYVQHRNMPVGSFSLSAGIEDLQRGVVKHHLGLHFGRDQLLSYDGWSTVKAEISSLPPKFEVTPLLREMTECLHRVKAAMLQDELPELVQSANYFVGLAGDLRAPDSLPCLMMMNGSAAPTQQEKMSISVRYISWHIVDQVLATSDPGS
ncbi:MAG TPA: hypothetical protein VHS06_01920 [Chloroflexota bacterium]|nr:hypothetical protein [Chloroflexota bacterium]